ncbi:hypothetical protein [Stutzerimonas azotifigens]|uniref:Secreted protein n=1 Tax=Stutzerimonas azotifigens TaxID=291995 RepID=A0ABR5Z1W8_9GAMM|nr:hypothetical protein [Stutzerimonas azotifigens]MBA1274193.1 hypothetical protein [Stutzerimonas azotifigens]
MSKRRLAAALMLVVASLAPDTAVACACMPRSDTAMAFSEADAVVAVRARHVEAIGTGDAAAADQQVIWTC